MSLGTAKRNKVRRHGVKTSRRLWGVYSAYFRWKVGDKGGVFDRDTCLMKGGGGKLAGGGGVLEF